MMTNARIKPLICSIALLISNEVVAQKRSQFVELRVGVTPLQIKDNFHSPYTYRGTGLGLQATYGQERLKTDWQLEGGYSQANPQSIVSRKASTRIIDAVFNYHWRLSPISKPESGLQYFGGIGLRFFGNSTNYSPDIEVATKQTTAAFTLGASAKATYRFNATHGLELQAFTSVLSAVYRPNYTYYRKDQLAATWLGKSPIADLQLRYRYQFSQRFQAGVFYQLNYFRYEQPRPVIGLRQQIGLGIRRTF